MTTTTIEPELDQAPAPSEPHRWVAATAEEREFLEGTLMIPPDAVMVETNPEQIPDIRVLANNLYLIAPPRTGYAYDLRRLPDGRRFLTRPRSNYKLTDAPASEGYEVEIPDDVASWDAETARAEYAKQVKFEHKVVAQLHAAATRHGTCEMFDEIMLVAGWPYRTGWENNLRGTPAQPELPKPELDGRFGVERVRAEYLRLKANQVRSIRSVWLHAKRRGYFDRLYRILNDLGFDPPWPIPWTFIVQVESRVVYTAQSLGRQAIGARVNAENPEQEVAFRRTGSYTVQVELPSDAMVPLEVSLSDVVGEEKAAKLMNPHLDARSEVLKAIITRATKST